MKNRTFESRIDKIIVPTLLAGSLFASASAWAVVIIKSREEETIPSVSVELDILVDNGLSGAILLGDADCPRNGSDPAEASLEVVQDYPLGGQESNLLNHLIAIDPVVEYLLGSGGTAYCGPDFGFNGERFDGDAIIISGLSTITD